MEEQNHIKIELKIEGMTCTNCELLLNEKLQSIEGVTKVYSHYSQGKTEVYANREISLEEFKKATEGCNFEIKPWNQKDKQISEQVKKEEPGSYLKIAVIAAIAFALYLFAKQINLIPQLPQASADNLGVIFLTGLLVGGLTCLAVQGGLLASVIAQREEEDLEKGIRRKHSLWPTASFLATKFVVYSAFGLLLGTFGKALSITPQTQITLQLIAGIYMLAVAGNLLNLHPIFRYAIIQPPRFLTRLVRNQSKSKDFFAPAFLGAMTIFIPCGTTLAMEALAISTANPVKAMAVMAAFIAGTTPLFFGVGFITTLLGDAFKTKFLKFAALAVLYLGLTSVNGALIAKGFPLNSQAIGQKLPKINVQAFFKSDQSDRTTTDSIAQLNDGKQFKDIKVYANRYVPQTITVKEGIPVVLNLIPEGPLGCTSSFVIPQFKVSTQVGTGTTVAFTPKGKGKVLFSCGMGMYRGVIEVI